MNRFAAFNARQSQWKRRHLAIFVSVTLDRNDTLTWLCIFVIRESVIS
jgi:hypothetical protein